MALKKETIQKIAAYFKLSDEDLEKAIKDEKEVDLPIGEFTVFTADEITSRDTAKLEEGKKEGQKIGEGIGKELSVKEMKKHFGIEFDGKDLTKLVDTVKAQLAKGDEGLKQQVQLLQKTVEEKETALTTEKQRAAAAMFDADLMSQLPSGRKGVKDGGLTDQEYLTILKSNLSFEEAEGKRIAKRGTDILRDAKTQNPLEISQAIDSFFTERNWKGQTAPPPPGGRGGGNQSGVIVAKNMSAFKAEWLAKNPDKTELSSEFLDAANKTAKEVEGFDYYN
jgi:hypothetical protein